MYHVRRAELKDLDGLVGLTEQIGEATRLPVHAQSVRDFAELMIQSPVGGLFVVLFEDSVVAAAGALVVPYHFNFGVSLAQGVILWSNPAHPGTGAMAVTVLEDWARSKGAKYMMLTTNDTIGRADRARKYLSLRGYSAEETNFVRTL